MAPFIAFGVMNVYAMIALAAVVASERLLRRADVVARWAGAACLILAVLVLAPPWTADTLVPSKGSMSNMNMTHTGAKWHRNKRDVVGQRRPVEAHAVR